MQDSTAEMLKTWQRKFEAGNIRMVVSGHVNESPKGGTLGPKNLSCCSCTFLWFKVKVKADA